MNKPYKDMNKNELILKKKEHLIIILRGEANS